MAKYFWGIAVLALGGCASGSTTDAPSQGGVDFGTAGGASKGPVPGDVGGEGPIFGGQPELPGAVFTAAHAPKPVSGGTLLVMSGNETAVVADPDRDRVFVVDLERAVVKSTIELEADAEPGRAADDAEGQVHLVLRGSGKLLTLDAATGSVLGTRDVCAYPRGVAVARNEKLVHVACAEGELVTLSTDARQVAPVRSLKLARDLRDVVVASDGLWVSRFRSAEVLRLDAQGKVVRTTTLPSIQNELGDSVASVAWRMVPGASGGVVVVHQRAFAGEVVPSPGGYAESGVPGGIVSSAITLVSETGVATSSSVSIQAPLPVDVAQSPVSGSLLLASATIEHPSQPSFINRTLRLSPSDLQLSEKPTNTFEFAFSELNAPRGQLVAVGFAGDVPVMQYREPSSLVIGDVGVTLPGETIQDTGSTLFHLETASGLACASCHPEGQEDGHVWHFSGFGPRRTQTLRGGLLGTEPFHWDGAEDDFAALTTDVMQGRMAGPPLSDAQSGALARYIDALPGMPASANAGSDALVARGGKLFNDAKVGCATCHSGARLSNDQTVSVGGAAPLQVPGLVGVWARAPYLHDGCAQTLRDRLTTCDTGQHGNLQGLGSDDLDAIVAYLDSL